MFDKNNSSHRFRPEKVLFFIIVFIGITAILSWLVMYLWNSILTDVTSVKPLNYYQALGLLILSKILFSGFRKPGSHWKHSPKNHWRKKWMEMGDEERQSIKSRWKDHCKNRDEKKSNE